MELSVAVKKLSYWLGGWGEVGWSETDNNATLWLHLTSWNMSAYLRIQDGVECGNNNINNIESSSNSSNNNKNLNQTKQPQNN